MQPLPYDNARHHFQNKDLNTPFLIRFGTAHEWLVRVEKLFDDYYFTDGWQQLLKDLNIQIGDTLVFEKDTETSFNIIRFPWQVVFQYVRPGAAPIPGAGPAAVGGAPGQVRPPGGLLPFAGRGRGEWRPAGINKNVPPNMQKNFHPGYGMQGWGNNGAGRGFGSGLDFTLPSHK
ncbi:hypothetical protein M8C21_020328 [Ambrosia artemisiifolia]|uniref:TF-B3 domain-containing protein n=1 Tax=Ambrosia artemisiifolia TaxID=4212 RepID=A0AAD5G7S0_AMBAR|nr:hypothetical protein M8C21_020328 [Ambrosia artemisiifolia]